MSVLVEFSDHVVIIEAPQGDERTAATMAAVKQLLPSKPIRYVVNTHQHFDHSGGDRGPTLRRASDRHAREEQAVLGAHTARIRSRWSPIA
jgi:glyoxylase-like metal-dependent hydrolase (beta-lactamase superfamily II)